MMSKDEYIAELEAKVAYYERDEEDYVHALKAENEALREALANINNFTRHTVVAEIEATLDKFMKETSWNQRVRPFILKEKQ